MHELIECFREYRNDEHGRNIILRAIEDSIPKAEIALQRRDERKDAEKDFPLRPSMCYLMQKVSIAK